MGGELLILLGFAAAVTAVFGIYSIFSDLYLRDRSRVSRRVDEQFRIRQRERVQQSLLFKDLALLSAEATEEVAKENSWRVRLTLAIEQAGMEVSVKRLLMIMLAAGLLSGALGVLIGRIIVIGPVLAVVGACIPLGYVLRKRTNRLGALMAQLADAFELMARCARAGQTMSQAMQAVADEDRKSTRLNSSHIQKSRMPSSA